MAPAPRGQPVAVRSIDRARAGRPGARPQDEQTAPTEPVAQAPLGRGAGRRAGRRRRRVTRSCRGSPVSHSWCRPSGVAAALAIASARLADQDRVQPPVVGGEIDVGTGAAAQQRQEGRPDREAAADMHEVVRRCLACGRSRVDARGRGRRGPRGNARAPSAPPGCDRAARRRSRRRRSKRRDRVSTTLRIVGSSRTASKTARAPGSSRWVSGGHRERPPVRELGGSWSSRQRKAYPCQAARAGPLRPVRSSRLDLQPAPDPVVGRDPLDAGPDQVQRRVGRRGRATPATRRSRATSRGFSARKLRLTSGKPAPTSSKVRREYSGWNG